MRPNTIVAGRTRVTDAQIADEQHLLRRVLRGDQKGWSEFCRRYERLIASCVIKVLRRYSACYSADDLADLTAEVWVALLRDDLRKLRLYDPSKGYRLASWVGLIAVNSTIDQLRQRSAECASLDDLTCVDRVLVDPRRPDAGLEQHESAVLARRALEQLSGEERAFVVSCYHEERRPEEIARELGVALNTVYSRKFKIRAKLVRIVADLDGANVPTALAA